MLVMYCCGSHMKWVTKGSYFITRIACMQIGPGPTTNTLKLKVVSIGGIGANPDGRSPSLPPHPMGFDWGNLEADSNGRSLSLPPHPMGFDWGNLEAASGGRSLLLGVLLLHGCSILLFLGVLLPLVALTFYPFPPLSF
uniref:Uncharacterized protein n=1 Tax=Nelumbo nucifera TaxID=4432 RepID=A0A822YQ77_NELNU|nr:TPA_asm: hypothetical protein HUJ06_006975 [Nelumbo nucifera]